MPEFDQSLYWKLVPYFRVPMERVHVILVVSGPSSKVLVVLRKKTQGSWYRVLVVPEVSQTANTMLFTQNMFLQVIIND